MKKKDKIKTEKLVRLSAIVFLVILEFIFIKLLIFNI